MDNHFIIYRSSAGSGKTYTLVKEYLLLALQNPARNYRHMLAITFTNKAMQEMKNRLIENLSQFSNGYVNDMQEDLIGKLQISEAEFIRRCKILLEKILHEYSYFYISTIDAFFQRIIRSFTKELGLYGQYSLELDKEIVKLKAIDDLLADLKEDHDLTKWVVKFSEEQLEEGKNWNIKKNLSGFAGELFEENFSALDGILPTIGEIKQLQKVLAKQVSLVENHLKSLSEKAFTILREKEIEIDELYYKKSGAISFLNFIREGIVKDPSRRSYNGKEEIDEWLSQKASRYAYLLPIVKNEIMPLSSHAIDFYFQNKQQYFSAKEALKFIYGLGLLSDLSQKIIDYKQDNDVLFIQDATRLIKALLKESDTPFIFEKVGTFYEHYLIDEFQDTSVLQWQCLYPLVYDVASQGKRNMIVGDTKQSIYRWRGGDWSLLQQKVIHDMAPQKVELQFLTHNYRSGGNVIDFNNKLFCSFSEIFLKATDPNAQEHSLAIQEIKNQINAVYGDSEQEIPDQQKNKGYVNISFLDGDEEEMWTEKALPKILETIKDALLRGYSLKDIALLVRKKDEASLLAEYLLSFTNEDGSPTFPVLTNEALLIKNSRVVMVIISALRYLISPDDKISLSELIFNYFIISEKESTAFHHWLDDHHNLKEDIIPFNLEKEKVLLQNLPIEEIVEHLIRKFQLPGTSGEEAYLQTFQDKVLEYGRSEGNDIASFLDWWDEKGSETSINIPSGLDAITIMTIHKVKGLQFPVVIVPFANWKIISSHNTILWANSGQEPFKGFNIPLKYTSALKETYFADLYYNEKYQSELDSLNMLYVAFTRAEQELYAFAPQKSNRQYISAFLLKVVTDENFELSKFWTPQYQQFEYGNKVVIEENATNKPENQVHLNKYVSHTWRDRLIVKKISGNEISSSLKEAIRGSEMHHLLSKIKYRDDLYKKEFFKALVDENLLENLNEIISHPEIAEYFTLEYMVLNEKNIQYKESTYRPDRIVIKDKEAIVIDYKWGQKQEKYKKQVQQYLELLRGMGYSYTRGFLYYVDQKSIEKVA